MSNFANWTENTFVIGGVPAINDTNLNKNETALTDIMDELNYSHSINSKNMLDYGIENNVREIHNFENSSDFASSGTITLSTVKYTDVLFGIGGVKMLDSDASSGTLEITDTITSVDCTTYPSGATEGSDDYVTFAFYMSDSTKFSSLLLRIGTDSSNCYYKFCSYSTGWNLYHITKSSFGTDGSPSGWDDITFVGIYAPTTASAQNEYIICNKLYQVRKVAGLASAFIVNDGSGNYDESPWIGNETYTITYFDKKIGKKGFQYTWESPYDMVKIMDDVNSFSFKCEMYSKIDSYGGSILWYIDSSNYIRVDVYDDLLIKANVAGAGVATMATGSISGTVSTGDRMMLWIDKTSDNIIRARLEIDGQAPVYAEWANTISATESGKVGFITGYNNQYYFVTDFTISNNNAIPLPTTSKSMPIMVVKNYDETVTSSTTLQNDDELFIKLPSNTLFEVQLVLVYSSTSATPDIKVAWSASGDYTVFNDGRVFLNYYAGASTIQMNNYALTSNASAGTAVTGEYPHFERILIKTGDGGCTLQLQWAQNTSNGTATQVDKGSYIIAYKL
jgi:hypothetical protein